MRTARRFALLVTGFYLILSGNQVATQRSFIMIGVVLLGVLFDRPALTMRTLTIAALVVLLFAPESIVHPSFQMSFAATLALIAGYERGTIKLRARAALVVASRGDPPADCQATVIDRALWRQHGALLLSRRGSEFIIESARPKNFDRPWSPAPVPREAIAATSGQSGQAETGSRARDATPRPEDIGADQ